MLVTAANLREVGCTDEQVEAFAAMFPEGSPLGYQVLMGTGWRTDWLALLIEQPRRQAVYADLDRAWAKFDAQTAGAMAQWEKDKAELYSLGSLQEASDGPDGPTAQAKAREAAEVKYERSTRKASKELYARHAWIISDALAKTVKWFPYAESETFESLNLGDLPF